MNNQSSGESVGSNKSPYTSGDLTMDGNCSSGCTGDPMTSNDGIDLPLIVLFLPENINMTWTHVKCVGAGLENVGNTCFVNSALQCLTYTAPFANYMVTGEHSATCLNPESCMMCIMEMHIIQVLCYSGTVICPVEVLLELSNIGRQFSVGHQEDAHEFLRYTVSALQKSCLSGFLLDRKSQATTFIHQVFGGYLRSSVKCLNCNAVSNTFEPFLDIPLKIETAHTIYNALEDFVKPEQLGGDNAHRCSKCQKMVTATKAFSIHRSSNVLTLLIKRCSAVDRIKITTVPMTCEDHNIQNPDRYVTYPEYLDMQPYMLDYNTMWYSLYAVMVHSGDTVDSGHFYCYVKASNGKWHEMNDSSVAESDIKTVLHQQAYILFYAKSSDVNTTQDDSLNVGIPSQASTQPTVIPCVNSRSEERKSRKRRHCKVDTNYYEGCPPAKHRRTGNSDGRSYHLLASDHTPLTNASANHHLGGYSDVCITEAERQGPGAALSQKSRSEERKSRKRRHCKVDTNYYEGCSPVKRRRTDNSDGRSYHLLASDHTSLTNASANHHLGGYSDVCITEAERQGPGAALSQKSRSEERKSQKRRHCKVDTNYYEGCSPVKRRRTDNSDGRSYYLPASDHTSLTNASAYHHLGGYSDVCITEAERQGPGAALSQKSRSEERKSRKRRHCKVDTNYYEGCSPVKRRRTDNSNGRSYHLLASDHTSLTNASANHHLGGYSDVCITEAERQGPGAALSQKSRSEERKSRKRRHCKVDTNYYEGCPLVKSRRTDNSDGRRDHLPASYHTSLTSA